MKKKIVKLIYKYYIKPIKNNESYSNNVQLYLHEWIMSHLNTLWSRARKNKYYLIWYQNVQTTQWETKQWLSWYLE